MVEANEEGCKMDLEEQMRIIAIVKCKLSAKSARLISLMISGSDLYGFSSYDSDVDLRGIFIYNTNALLGLEHPKETIEMKIGNYDIVMHELGKTMKLAYKGNANILEHISTKQIYTSLEFLELQDLIVLNKKGIYNSFKGLATHNYKKFIMTGRKKTIKKYLYVFRGLMAGIYALQVGKLEPDLEKLSRHFKVQEVKALIKLKKEGKEKNGLPPKMDTGSIELAIEKLFSKIDKAYVKTSLTEPTKDDWKELNNFLVKTRKKYIDT